MTECEELLLAESKMRPEWRRVIRYIRTVAITLAFCGCVLCALATYFRISSFRDLRAYGGMAAECHPIWEELAFRRIQPGDDFTSTLLAMPPDSQERIGKYTFHDYGTGFTSLRVFTKDNRIVAAGAGSCTWDYAFFDILPPEDWSELNRRYTLVLDERYRDEYGSTSDKVDDLREGTADGG